MFDNIVCDSRGCTDFFVLFHNLKYDWAVLSPQLEQQFVRKTINCMLVLSIINEESFVHRDSFKLISKPLRDFQKMFQLEEGKKEAIPYDYYTVDNILLDEMVPIDDVKSFFKLDDDKALFENILVDEFEDLTAFNFDVDLTNRTMNPVQYYKYYHKHDCITLRRGVEVFRQRIKEFTYCYL